MAVADSINIDVLAISAISNAISASFISLLDFSYIYDELEVISMEVSNLFYIENEIVNTRDVIEFLNKNNEICKINENIKQKIK